MQTYAVYMRPRGALASPLSSDMLFGAVCWGIQVLGLKSDVGDWLGSQDSPPFAFSAPFPTWFSDDRSLLRFYPRPDTFHINQQDFDALFEDARQRQKGAWDAKRAKLRLIQEAKVFKRVSFVSEGLLADVASGKITARQALRERRTTLWRNQFLLTPGEVDILKQAGISFARDTLCREIAVQRNHIDRVAGATVEGMLYYQNETRFARQAGLWALLRANSSDLEELILPALRYLSDTGLGADRTIGRGHFNITVEPTVPLPHAKLANGVMMLSRYLPADGELPSGLKAPLAYHLTTLRPKREQKYPFRVDGIVTPPIYKGAVRMFEPGSVFPLIKQQPIYGRLAEVVPQDSGGPVYQSGAAIPLFIKV